jgi:DNA-binding response OmpR family regulator
MSDKILVIDDDYDMLGLLGVLLHNAGYRVLQASSGAQGLKMAKEEKPELVLLDVMMPEMDGWEVARRLREISNMPIVFVTVLRDSKDVAKGLLLGDGYIIKPFDSRELIERIQHHLDKWKAESDDA